MNMAISFLSGSITFVLVMLIKVPIKKLNAQVAEEKAYSEEEFYKIYKRRNGVIYLCVALVALVSYCFILYALGEEHIKLCCSMKAAAIAIALYAVYEQLLGEV